MSRSSAAGRGRRLGILSCVTALAVALFALAPAVQAQDANLQRLIERVERLQREVQTLQRQVATGGTATGAGAGQPLPSDLALRYDARLKEYDDLVRHLTGRVEELEFKLRQADGRLERLSGEVEQLRQAAPARGNAAAGEDDSLLLSQDGMGASAGDAPAGNPTPPEGNAPNEPGVLGYLSESDLQGAQAAPAGKSTGANAAAGGSLPAGASPKEQYAHAFGLLRQANWPAAEGELRQFLEQHPDDPLAGNAMYWLGETHYVRQDYATAAKVFAEGFQSYPDSVKAPDNLLKLGMSLSSLKQNEDACGTFIELEKRYPDAPQEILRRAANERQRLGC